MYVILINAHDYIVSVLLSNNFGDTVLGSQYYSDTFSRFLLTQLTKSVRYKNRR